MSDDDRTPDRPEEPGNEGPGEGTSGAAGRKLDEDAAWREIVAHYGDEPVIEDPPPMVEPPAPSPPEPHRPERRRPEPPRPEPEGILEPGWQDDLNTPPTSWEDEGHFIPPTPPPPPPLDPRRRLAWSGLFGAPTMMLLAVVLGWRYPDWLMLLLTAGFIGGFGYLVATMPKSRDGDGPGDDGAVV